MRTASLLVLLLMASLVWAQQAPSAPPPPTAAAEPAPPAPPPEAAPPPPAAQPAPQLGHPLDPADVDTLTGRSSSTAYAPGYRYYYPAYDGAYPVALPLFGGSQFSSGNWATPMFSPFGFGRGNLFLFRHGRSPLPLFGVNAAFVGFHPHRGGRHR